MELSSFWRALNVRHVRMMNDEAGQLRRAYSFSSLPLSDALRVTRFKR